MSVQNDTMHLAARRRANRLGKVRILKLALPGAACLLLIVCIAQVVFGTISASAVQGAQPGVAKMIGPRFTGTNPDGRSFVITGADGMRDEKVSNRILITQPVLTLRTPEGKTRVMTSKTGAYDEAGHAMILTGDVEMSDGTGTQFTAQQARIDTRTQTISGQTGLQVAGQRGQVQSGTYDVQDEGDRLILKGGVRGRLTPAQK